jgi:tRNA pseudouridine38-40 synthase
MRYFAELAYNGAAYYGWQKQPGQASVQTTLEEAFSLILNTPIEVTGCGRTDTGVHAHQYFMHFDFEGAFPQGFINRMNKYLPKDIALYQIMEVAPDAHARFDANSRSYEYHLEFRKNPFTTSTAYHFPFAEQIDRHQLQQAAALLLDYTDFFPFCKTNTDVKTMKCQLSRCEWIFDDARHQMVFHISANRFLRGMVRLIVGMCLNVGIGKTSLEEVRSAMDQQKRLKQSWSVPPQGLFLTDIRYPFLRPD